MWNNNTQKLTQEEYFKSIRSRFDQLINKTDDEIAEVLDANNNRENYERDFALNNEEVSIDDSLIDLDRLQAEFPSIADGITHVLKDGGKGDILLIQYPKNAREKAWDGVISIPQDRHNFKFYYSQNIDLKRQDLNQYYLGIHIQATHMKDDFWRPEFVINPVMFERPAITVETPEWVIYSKVLTEEEFRELKEKNLQ